MIEGRCLCGAHVFRVEPPFELMHHCHCGFCRKTHGAAFATLMGVSKDGFRWQRQGERGHYESSPGVHRDFCAACGSPLPGALPDGRVFVPVGCLDGDPGERALAHIFAASRAPWFEIQDGLPAFDAFPPGFDAPAFPSREPLDPPSGVRGSCLCGDVRFVIEGEPVTARHCHCGRCRRARGAAHASNLVVPLDALRFTAGEDTLRTWRVPEARFFAQSFCGRCGSPAPRVDEGRGIAIVPLGALDDPPPVTPREHIWVDSKAPWYTIPDALPQRPGPPPG